MSNINTYVPASWMFEDCLWSLWFCFLSTRGRADFTHRWCTWPLVGNLGPWLRMDVSGVYGLLITCVFLFPIWPSSPWQVSLVLVFLHSTVDPAYVKSGLSGLLLWSVDHSGSRAFHDWAFSDVILNTPNILHTDSHKLTHDWIKKKIFFLFTFLQNKKKSFCMCLG